MKQNQRLAPIFALLLMAGGAVHAQNLVGAGSFYTDPFDPPSTVTHSIGGSPLTIAVNNGTSTGGAGIWDTSATGAAKLLLVQSGAETRLTGTGLEFGISADLSLLSVPLNLGTSVQYGWGATAVFDTTAHEILFSPNTRYHLSFNVDGSNGLLGSVLGVVPNFGVSLIDGNGTALASTSSGTLINLAGLLGTGVPTQTVTLDFDTGAIAPVGSLGVRFTGNVLLGATAIGAGDTFAAVNGLTITAAPVPEPTGLALLLPVALFGARRRRSIKK